jgi:2-dehydro-3-deoxy-L-fuconate 4-dehydrogenase
MSRLTDKTCLITGAAQGIGASVADLFLSEGANVIAVDLQFETPPLNSSSQALEKRKLDLLKPEEISTLANEFPNVDVVVNCAGFVATGDVLDCTHEELQRSLDLNVTAPSHVVMAFLPQMVARNDGVIINIASVVSTVMAAPKRFAYGTSKAALIGMTMSIARDFAGQGIRCNAISPGTVDTPSLHQRMQASENYETAMAAIKSRQLTGALGSSREIANIALLLASDEAKFMTGSNVIIDGGMSL